MNVGAVHTAEMRLPDSAHSERPWRIHEIAHDFRIEDVWALPTPGHKDDFPLVLQGLSSGALSHGSSNVARALFALRWKIGAVLGWDRDSAGVGARVPTLATRLPADLRDSATGAGAIPGLPFKTLYATDDEWAAEIANRTMHGVMHLGWVPDGEAGGYRGQMAVLVKPNGILGELYMAAIRPFRHLIVYPAMLRQIEREWPARTALPGASV